MEIASVDIEQYEVPIEEVKETLDKSGGALKIGIVGAGQAGGKIAEAFLKLGYTKAIYVNTTDQDKNEIKESLIFRIPNKPGGAGKNMKESQDAFKTHSDELYNKFTNIFGKVDHIFVCAGLGGGSGSGVIVPVLELAKKYMKIVCGFDDPEKRVGAIITLPTLGESSSPVVASNALSKGKELSELADNHQISPLIVIDNEKIKNFYKGLTVAQFYPTINNTIAQMFNVFNQIANMSSEFITFDATDYISVLQCGGHMVMGVTVVKEFEDKTAISSALNTNLAKTLLASDFDLATAEAAAVIVVAGVESINHVPGLMDNIEYGCDTISNLTGNAMVHRGIYSDTKNDKIRVYTMISGLKGPENRYEKLRNSIPKSY